MLGLCEPCGADCVSPAPPQDAGTSVDAGQGSDAGEPEDAGVVEPPDAGVLPEDGGPPSSPDAGDPVLVNLDLACGTSDAGVLFPPAVALPDSVPADCLRGFEMNNFHGTWSTDSLTLAGSRAIELEVDVATYQAPDDIRISGTVNGAERDLFATCRMQTSTYGDRTGGLIRPQDDCIREFRLDLPTGTTRLTFDFSNATTPTYIRVLGLCDFDLQPPAPVNRKWRLVTAR